MSFRIKSVLIVLKFQQFVNIYAHFLYQYRIIFTNNVVEILQTITRLIPRV